MNWGKTRISNFLLSITALTLVSISAGAASEPPRLSGWYRIVHQEETGGQARVRLQIHLVNALSHDLRIQRMTVWDMSHPTKGATQACSLVIRAGGSVEMIQEFMIPRAEYDLWRRGARPRLVLEIATPIGRPASEVVHLDRASEGKGN